MPMIMETNTTQIPEASKIQISHDISKTQYHPLISPKGSNPTFAQQQQQQQQQKSPTTFPYPPPSSSPVGNGTMTPNSNNPQQPQSQQQQPNGGMNPPFAFTAPFIVGSNGQPFALTHYPLLTTPTMFSQITPSLSFSSRGPTRQRVVNSAERRASHNAVERARRDNLNNRFQEMAEAVPTLKEIKRPSKTLIMQKTVEYVKMAQKKQESQGKEIQVIKKENEKLKEELRTLRDLLQKMSEGERIDLSRVIVNLNSFEKENGITNEPMNQSVDVELDFYPNKDCEKTPVMVKSEDKIENSLNFETYIDSMDSAGEEIDDQQSLREEDEGLFGYPFDTFGYMKEKDDDFNFDVMRAKVESGLVNRHDRDWLKSKGILDDTSPTFYSAQKAMEFNMKKKNLSQMMASRKSKEDLVDLNIISDCKDF